MPFKFRLAKVLTLRQDELEAARVKMAKTIKDLDMTREYLELTKVQLEIAHVEMIKDNYAMPKEHARNVKRRTDNRDLAELKVKELEEQLIKDREAVVAAQMKVEALEKLREKQEEEFLFEENRLEQKQTDENVSLKFASDMLKTPENTEEEDVWADNFD